jgi:tight adherence protein B
MTPLLLSLTLGLGVACLYAGLTARSPFTLAQVARRRPPAARFASRELQDILVRAGLPGVTPRDFALFALGAGLATALVAHLLLGWGVVTLAAFLSGLGLPVAYYGRRQDRRSAAVQAALAEAVAQLRDGIRAGLGVPEAFTGLARTGPEALRPDFGALAAEARLHGFRAALTRLRDRLADPLFDVVCAGLILNDDVGGRHLSHVLDRLAESTRAELRLQEELRAQQARTVLSARIVALVPVFVLVAVRSLNPGYLAVFDSWEGQLLLAGCALSVAVGYAGMRWMTRLPRERRVLA